MATNQDRLRIQSVSITTNGADNEWVVSIQDENWSKLMASFPRLDQYVILLDGEPVDSFSTVSRVFSMSPYNHFDCFLVRENVGCDREHPQWRWTVETIVVTNSLLGGVVVHRIDTVKRY